MTSRAPQPQAKANPKQSKRFRKIADLDFVTLKKLSDRLDIPGERNWRKLIENMPSCHYDSLTVEKFGLNANKSDGSPGYALLLDMSNRGVSYDELITAFKKMQFDTALQDIGYRGRWYGWSCVCVFYVCVCVCVFYVCVCVCVPLGYPWGKSKCGVDLISGVRIMHLIHVATFYQLCVCVCMYVSVCIFSFTVRAQPYI